MSEFKSPALKGATSVRYAPPRPVKPTGILHFTLSVTDLDRARRFYEELSSLRGEDGARQFLERHPDWVTLFEVDDPGVLRDIDKPSDLER